MREILFRGKHVDNGEWVYGYYVPACFGRFPCRPAIVPEPNGTWRPIEVELETIGQYTGLTDKNGKKIFEGDVVHVNYTLLYRKSSSVIVQEKIIDYKAKVMFSKGRFHLKVFDGIEYELSEDSSVREVIGNIHDNPELLEVKE